MPRLHRFLVLLLGLATAVPAAEPQIRLVNDARLPAAEAEALMVQARLWALRVYRYNEVTDPLPVNLVLSDRVRIGYYMRPNVYVPPSDAGEMLETWVHELAHHATGHDSSFFFKEGIATHTLEALFAQDGRVPQGFPQYGQTIEAWTALFQRRGELPPLATLMTMDSYDSSSRDAAFRSWQVYIVAASFAGWLIRSQGYPAFHAAFTAGNLGSHAAEWEGRWRTELGSRAQTGFSPKDYLPARAPYLYYAERLGSP